MPSVPATGLDFVRPAGRASRLGPILLLVGALAADLTRRRVNFVFQPGDRLMLVSDNAAAAAPNYDLALVADRVLASPAEAASLGPLEKSKEAPKAVPRWFWLFVLAAAGILLFALGRTLKREPERPAG